MGLETLPEFYEELFQVGLGAAGVIEQVDVVHGLEDVQLRLLVERDHFLEEMLLLKHGAQLVGASPGVVIRVVLHDGQERFCLPAVDDGFQGHGGDGVVWVAEKFKRCPELGFGWIFRVAHGRTGGRPPLWMLLVVLLAGFFLIGKLKNKKVPREV